MSVQVKICGITRPEDAATAAELGATHVGCVATADSPRCVTPEQAREIFQAAGRKVKQVLVLQNLAKFAVMQAAKEAGTKHVQLSRYDEADAVALEEEGFTVYRVHEIPTGANILPTLEPEPNERSPGVLQVATPGTGITFPWEILGSEAPHGAFIGGGVRPENVCALLTHHPYGINISSGLELKPGIKDRDRMILFFETLRTG